MNTPTNDATATLSRRQRQAIYALIICSSLSIVGAKIATITRDGETPMLSANDRSRWCTIRAIVDHGTYAIDQVIFDENGKRIGAWQTIDLVHHRNVNGTPHYYSSKPPLLPTLCAGPYWVVKRVTGSTMGKHPMYVIRILLVMINVPCLALILWWTTCLVERYGKTDWGRILVVATAAGGTFLTSFSVTLNNHLLASLGVTGCLVCIMKIGRERDAPWWCYFGAGLAAAFTSANELPALSFLCLVLAFSLVRNPRHALTGTCLGAALIVVTFFVINYRVHNSLRPAYAHRGLGTRIADLPNDQFADYKKPTVKEIRDSLPESERKLLSSQEPRGSQSSLRLQESGEGFAVWDRWGPILALQQGEGKWTAYRWDDWYDYPIDKTPTRRRSYWKGDKQGVDRGEPSRAVYAFHALAGHHGIFSLTPLWLLAFVGLGVYACAKDERRWFALSVLLLAVVCLSFYVLRPEHDRNYGGVSSGFRWMFWFIPFWLLALLPVADWASGRPWMRRVCYLMFAIGAFSVHYGLNNPWTQPWIFDHWTWLQWIDYQ